MAGPFGVSGIGREVVPQHQPHRDEEGDSNRRANDPSVHERGVYGAGSLSINLAGLFSAKSHGN
jgi:hypothetical protein